MGIVVPAVLLVLAQLVRGRQELIFVAVFLIVFLILTPYGYHVGRKQILCAYMEYLLKRLPVSDQSTIVSQAFELTRHRGNERNEDGEDHDADPGN